MTSIKRKFFWTGTRNRTRRPASDQRCAGRWLAGMKKLLYILKTGELIQEQHGE